MVFFQIVEMEPENQSFNIGQTHNLFIHKYIDNKQAKFIHLTKLDTHKFLYENGFEHKYVSNLILGGSNFIQIYVIFHSNLTLDLGFYNLYEDINSMHIWDKNIILVSNKKIVALVYEDYMLKNSFMLSLENLELSQREKIEIIGDKLGFYMCILTSRELLICVSQKAIQKHKAKPYYHKNMRIMEEDMRWSRCENIGEVIKIDFDDYDFSKVESLYFSEDKLYFMASSNKNNYEKNLYFLLIDGIFDDKNDQSLITIVSQQKQSTKEIYIIPKGNQTEYLIIKNDNTIQLENRQKGLILESKFSTSPIKFLSKKHYPLFPIQIFHQNTIFIYERLPDSSFNRKEYSLPTHANEVDIKDNLIVYCNLTQVGLINTSVNSEAKILWRSFGNIIDFCIGLNTVIIENHTGNQCKLYKIRKGLLIDQTPFATHIKKRFLQDMVGIQQIRSLQETQYLLIKVKTSQTYKLYDNYSQELKLIEQNIFWEGKWLYNQKVIIIFWMKEKLQFFQIQEGKMKKFKQMEVQWESYKKIKIIEDWLILENDLKFIFFNLKEEKKLQRNVPIRETLIDTHMIKKEFVFKRKEKDYLIVQLFAFFPNAFQIWEFCICQMDEFKKIHRTDYISEGLPFLLHSNETKNCYRSLTCPEYIVLNHVPLKELFIKKVYVSDNLLLMVNSNEELLMYKKQYCSYNEVGYIYRRIILPLSIYKRFKYQQNLTFVQIGCKILRISNYAYYKQHMIEIPESIKTVFEMEGQIWTIQNNGKIHKLVTKGQIISNFLVVKIESSIQKNIIGIQATNENYIIYSPSMFEVYDKQMELRWKSSQSDLQSKEVILSMCGFEHYIALSYLNYCQNEENEENYESIKFKFRIYNIITKSKVLEKEKSLEEPILYIKYVPVDKLILVSPSNIFVYSIKNDKTLETIRNKNYTKRTLLSSFSYIPEKIGNQPGYMIFGGAYGGLSFMCGQWIDKQKLDEIWFENIKCQIRQVQLFHYGSLLKALIADEDKNLIVLNLKPNKGEKLADFHMNSKINSIKKRNQKRYQTPYFCCNDGSIRILFPVELKDAEVNFLDFQDCICKQIPLLGGFNTRDSRRLCQKYRTYKITSSGNIVDGDLITDFVHTTSILKSHIFEKTDLSEQELKNGLLKMI